MKILCLSNYPLPEISQAIKAKTVHNEGWKWQLSKQCRADEKIKEFIVVFPCKDEETVVSGVVDGVRFSSFVAGNDPTKIIKESESGLLDILKRYQPDVIHVWGTEFPHTLALLRAAIKAGMEKRVVVSIQGVMEACAKHFDKCLPRSVYRRKIGDYLLHRGVNVEKKAFLRRAENENKALKLCQNVIGRTDFDYAYAKNINKDINYFYASETMREEFYQGAWQSENLAKHTLFMGQGTYPVKGLHIVLQILAEVKKVYPDVVLRIAGGDMVSPPKGRLAFLKQYAYRDYLQKLIKVHHLEENILPLGTQNAQQMKEEMLASSVLISGSTVENSSNSVAEAMLLGVPVVSSNVGGMTNIVEHGKNGFLYQFDDVVMGAYYIMKLFGDASLAQEFSQKAKETAHELYNSEKNFLRLLDIYQDVQVNAEKN